jgi:site-specific DNA-methyltransferase (adenine-specific)
MELYSNDTNYKLYQGNMLNMLEVLESNSIDSIITDPPYELNFMSKGWDNAGVSFKKETWQKCLKVLKPGGYLLAFGGSRTFHRIACAIEDAGFEIRDTIMWLYGSRLS